jgi:hypothetical protein
MIERLVNAIKVVLLTPGTRAYLMVNDPQALKQLTKAIDDAGYPLTDEQTELMSAHVQEILTDKELAEYQAWACRNLQV